MAYKLTKIGQFPELVVSTRENATRITTAHTAGRLKRITRRIYTTNLNDAPENIIRRNLWSLVAALVPGALITDRTALDGKPAKDGSIFVIADRTRPIILPGLSIHVRTGAAPLPSDKPFIEGLYMASIPRALLENIRRARSGKNTVSRTFTRIEMEEYLETILRRSGQEGLNHLRDETRQIATQLNLNDEFSKLDKLMGALLHTHTAPMRSAIGKARVQSEPYDPNRVKLFEALFASLRGFVPTPRPAGLSDLSSTLHFYESYFSNYIEGTKFEVPEALEIVFDGKQSNRPADAHDVLGTYNIVSDGFGYARVPNNADRLLILLRERHGIMMAWRSEMTPGIFKDVANYFGGTEFVKPELVTGTLTKGYEIYQALAEPFHRAVFMMFLVAEVHPFRDGNGRMARIMMNAELVAAQQQRVIIPTILRSNYLSALRAMTHNSNPEPLIRVLDYAQRWVASINWQNLDGAYQQLLSSNAFMESNEAEEKGIRLELVKSP